MTSPRRFSWITVCATAAVLWAVSGARDAWAVEIYTPELKGTSGRTVTVPMMVDEVENLAGIKLVIRYDKDLLTYKTGTRTKESDSLIHIVNDQRPGILVLVMAGARGIKGKNITIFNFVFEVSAGLKEKKTTSLEITEVELMSDSLKKLEYKVRINPMRLEPEKGR